VKKQLEHLEYRGDANLETIRCPLCGSHKFKTLVVEQTLPVVRCLRCGLVFVNPRPDRAGLAKFYERYFPPESDSLWQEQMAEVFMKEGLEPIRSLGQKGSIRLPERPRILDIGCGMGFFLDLMRQAGWEVKGIEPAPAAAGYAREKLKLDVFQGTLEQAAWGGVFDAATLWYVLEHVPNPGEILARAARLLKPGGLLIVRVPNQNAAVDRVLNVLGLRKFFLINPPRHLFDYSPATLSAFLRTTGFEILEIRNGIPRAAGTWLERIRRRLWYGFFQAVYVLSGGKIVRGSSMTCYARKA